MPSALIVEVSTSNMSLNAFRGFFKWIMREVSSLLTCVGIALSCAGLGKLSRLLLLSPHPSRPSVQSCERYRGGRSLACACRLVAGGLTCDGCCDGVDRRLRTRWLRPAPAPAAPAPAPCARGAGTATTRPPPPPQPRQPPAACWEWPPRRRRCCCTRLLHRSPSL